MWTSMPIMSTLVLWFHRAPGGPWTTTPSFHRGGLLYVRALFSPMVAVLRPHMHVRLPLPLTFG